MGSPTLLLMLLVLYQVQLSVSGCTDLYKTIEMVPDCPRTETEWNVAAIRKKCDAVCPKSKYHCVISKDMNATMEVCAELKYMQGYCAYFNIDDDRIRDLLAADCSQFANPCPSRYPSTEAFKYTACYDLIKVYVVQQEQTTSKGMTDRGSQTEETSNTVMLLAIIIPIIIILLIASTIVLIVFIRRRKQPGRRRQGESQVNTDLRLKAPEDFSTEESKPFALNENKISTENENKPESTKVEELKKQCDEKDTELAKLRERIETLLKARDTETEQKEELIQKQEKEKLNLQQQFLEKNKECKELNNKLQEAKGNIRVLCRIRKTNEEKKCLTVLGNSIQLAGKPKKLTFEKVFEEDSKQKDVYSEIRELVRSFLDGYNLCIFAYGQTGSGKTYTMDGGSESEDAEGVIPRAIKQVFEDSEAAKCGGWIYEFSASYLELYNEKIRDLAKGADDKKPREIKSTANGKVDNLTTCDVHTKDEVMKFYKEASKNRTSAKTRMNEESSRSHAVFRLEMKGTVENVQDRDDSCSGTLTLVDLAGSERMDQQAGTTTNLETNKINLSLLELGRVLRSLLKKEKVTYRNSVLTRLLQTSLGGNSKTLMIVNVSPSMACQRETERSLDFGSEVSKVVLERAKKNK